MPSTPALVGQVTAGVRRHGQRETIRHEDGPARPPNRQASRSPVFVGIAGNLRSTYPRQRDGHEALCCVVGVASGVVRWAVTISGPKSGCRSMVLATEPDSIPVTQTSALYRDAEEGTTPTRARRPNP